MLAINTFWLNINRVGDFMYKFIGKKNQYWQLDIIPDIKLNYRCEENPPGSGNFKCDVTANSDKTLDKTNKLRLKDSKTKLKEIKARNQSIRDQMGKVRYDSPEWKQLQSQIDTDKEYELEKHIKILSYKHPDVPETFKSFLVSSDTLISSLPEPEKKQLNLYVAGWGNSSYQGLLAEWKGKIPKDPEAWMKDKIGKRYSFSNGDKFDPNDSFQVKELKNSMEALNHRLDSIKSLDSILDKSKSLTNIVIQTGISPTLLELNNLQVGSEFEIPTYVSTSRSDVIANGFALRKYSLDFKHWRESRYKEGLVEPTIATVLEVHLKSGSKALALENFVLQSQGADADWVVGDKGIKGTGSQQEVLLARGTKYKVKDITETTFRGKKIRKLIVDAYN